MTTQKETPPAGTEGEKVNAHPNFNNLREVLPGELLNARRWLLWRYAQKPNEPKSRKVPYYANGYPRGTEYVDGQRTRKFELDSPEDVQRLATFDEAVAAYQRYPGGRSGIGFAVVAGDPFGGGDVDDCLDEDGNIIDDEARQIFQSAVAAGCYVEASPSGRGLRFFGDTAGFAVIKEPKLEAYCRARYLTVTGNCIANPKGIGSVDGTVALMRQLADVGEESKGKSADANGRTNKTPSSGGYVPPDRVEVGGRNAAVLAYVGHLRSSTLPEASVRSAAHDFSRARCDPPLPDDEVDDLVDRYQSQQAESPDWLSNLNAAYAWINENAGIYRIRQGDFIRTDAFKTAHDNISAVIDTPSGSKKLGVGSLWLKDPKRRQHERLVIRPGEGLVTHDNCLNEYRGPVVAPGQGGIGPFLLLAKRLIPSRIPFYHVLGWMAHLIQHPDVKMHTSLVVWSHEQGPGKNLLFECLVKIIGSTHATVIGQSELSSSFNGWANRKVFVIGDEVSGSDRRQDTDKLKGLVTGTTIYINEKHQPAREVPNLLNFIFLSNHHDALFLNDHDRRYFVWEVTAPRLPQSEAEAFVRWRDNGGVAALHYALLHYDISTFDPKAPAPMTDAKMQMIQDNRSDMEAWTAELMGPDVAKVIGREVAGANELARRYAFETGHREPSAKTIVGACKRNGAYARDSQVRLQNGKKVRVLALTRPDYWKAQPESAWSEEMAKEFKFG